MFHGAPATPLLMGHRGTGSCDEQKQRLSKCVAENLPIAETVRENTLKAMKVAHKSGGHYVEFDVQLSKDKVPIVHHDFYLKDGRFVGDVELEELLKLSEFSTDDNERQFPTLNSFFKELPQQLGFDIEIKYPRKYLDGTSFCPEFNWKIEDYLERIVATVKECSGDSSRPMFYSCFVSDVCILLKKLHPECPVVYIACGDKAQTATETNGYTPETAFEFAKSAGLFGVALHASTLLDNKEFGMRFVQKCKQSNLRCFTWGIENNEEINRKLQTEWGIDGLLFDNIHFSDKQC